MGIGLVKGSTAVFIKKEVTEGVYIAPASGADAIEILEDGFEMSITKEEIERNVLSSTIETEASRPGLKSVSGSIPVEYKASSTLGAEPREGLLFESMLGGKRQVTTESTSLIDHTTSRIYLSDADRSKYEKNDILLAKIIVGGDPKWQVRPVLQSVDGAGADEGYLEFAVPFMDVPQDGCVIARMTQYFHQEGAPTLSLTRYIGGKIRENVTGLRAISGSLEGWTAGETSSWNFSVEGVNGERIDGDFGGPAFNPTFDSDSLPPVIIEACLWLNAVETDYESLSMSLENEKTDLKSACAPSGKIGSRFTKFTATMEFNPYMKNDDIDRFQLFELNQDLSVFGFARLEREDGSIGGVVAFWMPQSKITAIPSADVDGIVTDAMSVKGYRKEGNDTIFLAFI